MSLHQLFNDSLGQRKEILRSPCQRILHQSAWRNSDQNFLCIVM